MSLPTTLAALQWLLPAMVLATLAWAALVWAYARASSTSIGLRIGLGLCKALAIGLLLLCLLEPVAVEKYPKPDANVFVVLADQSQSMSVHDKALGETRIAALNGLVDSRQGWVENLDEYFDVRRYTFGDRLESVDQFSDLQADASRSSVISSLQTLAERFHGRSVGGIMLLTDGIATNASLDGIDWSSMPPVYPVIIGDENPNRDIRISNVSISQTNFEAAPITINTEMVADGFQGKSIVTRLMDGKGNELERQTVTDIKDGRRFAVRFEVRPEHPGVSFFTVQCFEKSMESQIDDPEKATGEATFLNNRRLVAVNRGKGPYRILYVSGRPNWELKFLRRALSTDDEIELVSLVRIAKREPKFSFRGRTGETTNPLFRGFGNEDDEQAEQYDEPVMLRLGTEDEEELRDGFPIDEEELYRYDAIILDDLESEFFTQDQKTLLHQFVSIRGGSLLMLGGQESFAKGRYDRTPIGEMLPVYLDDSRLPPPGDVYQLALTREGWLQPWVRVRPTEQQEQTRIDEMPPFKTVNRISSIKPGAHVLSRVEDLNGDQFPAMVVQNFGKGRAGAILIGDLWRWRMKDNGKDDLSKSWRQTARWLVADVPSRVQLQAKQMGDALGTISLEMQIKDEKYMPIDNANLNLIVTRPDQSEIELAVESSEQKSGVYLSSLVPADQGAYRAKVIATAPDGSEIGLHEIGWSTETQQSEFSNLDPNRELLNTVASKSGGEVVEASSLDRFVKSVPNHQAMITETKVLPWWHHWLMLSTVLVLLVTEWGVRRWKGLP